jgi:hypothetical protein
MLSSSIYAGSPRDRYLADSLDAYGGVVTVVRSLCVLCVLWNDLHSARDYSLTLNHIVYAPPFVDRQSYLIVAASRLS